MSSDNKTKQCILCKESKARDAFAKNTKTNDGLQNYCKSCQKVYRNKLKQKPKLKVEYLQCSRCNITKTIDDFPKVNTSSTGYGSWCKECKRTYQKTHDYYEKHKNRRRERVKWFRSIKTGVPCTDCGQIFEPSCMDYDHIGNNKIENVARMVVHNFPKEKILEEIEKCELVCALCHNRRTQKRLDEKGENKYSPHMQRNIDIINKAKSVPCECCRKQYEPFNMQFDHIDPMVKDANVCQLKNATLDKLMLEISRCRVLCIICHRKKNLAEQIDNVYPKSRKKEVKKTFIDIDNKKKECTKCHKILDFDQFNIKRIAKSGLDSCCRKCSSEYKRNKRVNKG